MKVGLKESSQRADPRLLFHLKVKSTRNHEEID